MPISGEARAHFLSPVDRPTTMQYDAVAGLREYLRDRGSDTPGRTCDENSSGHRFSFVVDCAPFCRAATMATS